MGVEDVGEVRAGRGKGRARVGESRAMPVPTNEARTGRAQGKAGGRN